MQNITNLTLLTDLYQLTMMEAYFFDGRKDDQAAFDYFFRKIPFNGGYVVFAGLSELLESLSELRFTQDDLAYLKEIGFREKFLNYLERFTFNGDVYSVEEGSIIFPNEPLLSVRGNLIECQFVETILLNTLNFNSLIATKASRMRLAAGNKILGDFGLRRSHGLGGIQASKAAIIGGFDSTSNVLAAHKFDLKPVGTMAHSYIQSYKDELTAFRKYAEAHPGKATLLVDTYDTLKSGIPNAIKIAKELEQKGDKLAGVRLDSGDLISLSLKVRKMLDEAGLKYVKIVASNQLDEYLIKNIVDEDAPIDIFGVGTNLVTGQPDAALDGVYKLSMINNRPSLKLSETDEKITLPGLKQILRHYDEENYFFTDVIINEDEEAVKSFHPIRNELEEGKINTDKTERMLSTVMSNGRILIELQTPTELSMLVKSNLEKLPAKFKDFKNPGTFTVGLSKQLVERRNILKRKFSYLKE